MDISPDELSLLEEILSDLDGGISAVKFRAQRGNKIPLIDALERRQLIERRDGKYHIRLPALVYLAECNDRAQTTIATCERLFDSLRLLYINRPGEQLSMDDLVSGSSLPEDLIRREIGYLFQAPIWSSHSSDPSAGSLFVTPSEGILRFNTFQDAVDQLLSWASDQDKHAPPTFRSWADRNEGAPTVFGAKRPRWFAGLKNPDIRVLLDEVYRAIESNLTALPAMGLRAVLDCICNEKVGDRGNFKVKLDLLLAQGHISSARRKTIENILEVGHASMHRGYVPTMNDIEVLLEIVEGVVHELYVSEDASVHLVASVPGRRKGG